MFTGAFTVTPKAGRSGRVCPSDKESSSFRQIGQRLKSQHWPCCRFKWTTAARRQAADKESLSLEGAEDKQDNVTAVIIIIIIIMVIKFKQHNSWNLICAAEAVIIHYFLMGIKGLHPTLASKQRTGNGIRTH